jgi:TonB family protein
MRSLFLFLFLSSLVAFSQGKKVIINSSTTKKNVNFLSLDKIAGEVITFTGINVKNNTQDWYEKHIFLNDSEVLQVVKSQLWSGFYKRETLSYIITKYNYRKENNKIVIDQPAIQLRISNDKAEVDSSESKTLVLTVSDNKQQFELFTYYLSSESDGRIQFSNKSRYLTKSLSKLSNVYLIDPYPSDYNQYVGKIISNNKYEIVKEVINLGFWSLLNIPHIENIGNLNINEEIQKYERVKEIEKKFPTRTNNKNTSQRKNNANRDKTLPPYLKRDVGVTKPEPPPEEVKGMRSSERVKGKSELYEPPVDPDERGSDPKEPPHPAEEEIFTAVEQNAEFPGGPRAFSQFIQRNLRYPSAAVRANVGGKVYVQFVVNKDGTIQDIKVLKSVGFGCDEEAIRLIKSVPRWTPGKQSGRAVRSRFTQPITFVLPEEITLENQPINKTEVTSFNDLNNDSIKSDQLKKTDDLKISPFLKLQNIRRGLKIIE